MHIVFYAGRLPVSGRQKQWVALLWALLIEHDLLMVDDLFTALDGSSMDSV
jgi:ABC-type nitrate/sulfonate/bicarbonate transport system ATPase subunit